MSDRMATVECWTSSMSAYDASPPVRSRCMLCSIHVVPVFGAVAMMMSVGRGRQLSDILTLDVLTHSGNATLPRAISSRIAQVASRSSAGSSFNSRCVNVTEYRLLAKIRLMM